MFFFHSVLNTGSEEDVCTRSSGTKCSGHFKLQVKAGQSASIKCRLTHISKPCEKEMKVDWSRFSMEQQQQDANHFYDEVVCPIPSVISIVV